MQVRFEETVQPSNLPESYVLVALYGGTSNFPMGSFYVLRTWWDLFKADSEVVVVPLANQGVSIVDVAKAE